MNKKSLILLLYFLQNNHNSWSVNVQLSQNILYSLENSLMYSLAMVHHIPIILSLNKQRTLRKSVFHKLFLVIARNTSQFFFPKFFLFLILMYFFIFKSLPIFTKTQNDIIFIFRGLLS